MRLIVENLTCVRGHHVVLRELSFVTRGGTGLILTGPNGSGKTTLLRTVAGFLRPQTGRVFLEDSDSERTLTEQLHYVGHLDGIKSSLTVYENLIFWHRYFVAATSEARIKEALDLLGLWELADIPGGYLSAGQRRRLSLARLLVAERSIWLLDEPTVALDAASQVLLNELLNNHIKSGGMALVATHLPLAISQTEERNLGVRS